METNRIFTSHGEEKELLEEEEVEEYGDIIPRRPKAYFHFGPKASFAISFALLLSFLFNLYHEYSYSYKACVVDSQWKPGLVTRPSYCKFDCSTNGSKFLGSSTDHLESCSRLGIQ